MEQKQSFSTSEVAKFCHVTADTIRKWAEAKRITVFKTPGGHRRIRREDLVTFMRKNGIPLNSELCSGGTKVLLIDGDQRVFTDVKRFLDDADPHFEIEVATDGFEAGHRFGTFSPKVVFVDMSLPGIDGAVVCHQINTVHPHGTDIKIIATTNHYTEAIADGYISMGANLCLKKPFSPEELRRALDTIGVETS